ncbi:MAG: glycine cleavage system aminomethyltransferase GcvT, partial [Chloroflexota bacterium]|nr:glycine cleavage system aminomethyltransferase GcvT [Chloroflexota bacterium]
MTTDAAMRRTPLYEEHQSLGARMVPFAGYEMPIQYTGIVAEHRAVRESVGLFDLSHMGEFHFDGAGAQAAVDRLVSSDIAGLEVGQARYGLLCNERGTIVDDVIVYRTGADHLLMVVNAANIAKDEAHVRRHLAKGVGFADRSAETALIAIQGPRAADVLVRVAGGSVAALPPFGVKSARAAGAEATIARTGYTGEDGFEVFIDNADAVQVWQALLVAGRGDGIVPVGLGARDTLRLEARFSL